MADASYLDQVLGWLRGSKPETNTTVNLAPPLYNYPSNQDAEFARKSGFSQGSPNESFLDNTAARVYGHDVPIKRFDDNYLKNFVKNSSTKPSFSQENMFMPDNGANGYFDDLNWSANDPKSSKIVNPQNDPYIKNKTDNIMMRAALAANRNPIAAMGFDPNQTIIDTEIKNPTAAGLTNPENGSMYTNIRPEDAIVHESTHNGLNKLRAQFPEQYDKLMYQLPSNESVVRWLMNTTAGDPEAFHAGREGARQRSQAISEFNNPVLGDSRKKALDQLQEMAIGVMKDHGKRAGPQ